MRLLTGLILTILVLPGYSSGKSGDFKVGNKTRLSSQTFLSQEYKTEKFTGLIYEFDVKMSADDLINGYVRLLDENGGWSEWVLLTENTDVRSHSHDVYENFENLVNSNDSYGFQFRFNMRSGADSVLPMVDLVNWEVINVNENFENVVASTSQVASLEDINDNFLIISRNSWGADDSLNYTDEYTDEDWEAVAEYLENENVSRIETEMDGNLLKWPLQYTNDVKFLAVHHTATTANLDDPRQAIRNIQYYHAVSRGWGDIGYNYIIDRQGNIYEGRAGGRDVIGGHSREVNKVSVGISLLGNYQNEDVPEATLESLAKLLRSLADDYNLDVNSYDTYEGRSYPVLGGHGDYSATSCPGIYGRSFLPILRNLVSKADDNLDYEVESITSLTGDVNSGYLTTGNLDPSVRNLSGKSWNSSNTYLLVSHSNNDVLGSEQTKFMLKDNTRSGQIGTFDGQFYGKAAAGLYEIDAELYVNGRKVSNSDLKLGAYVKPDIEYEVNENDSVPEGSQDDAPTIANPFAAFYRNRNTSSSSSSTTSSTNVSTSNTSTTNNVFQVNSSSSYSVTSNSAVEVNDPRVRVLISKFDLEKTYVEGSDEFSIVVDGESVEIGVDEQITIWQEGEALKVKKDDEEWQGSVIRIIPEGEVDEKVLKIVNYANRPAWNTKLNDNKFRGVSEFRIVDGKMRLINELGIESYLLGLAEVPDSEHIEKAKTIVVAARSYAYYYSNGHGRGLKYKGKPYHLNDSPESSQKYLGYGFEMRSSLNKKAVLATKGETITWFDYDVVIPYFSESDGRTRTPREVWGWSRFKAPYLTSVDDSFCKGGEGKLWGHGVGISGCGASGMAEIGYTYEEIINYYLKGIEIVEKY